MFPANFILLNRIVGSAVFLAILVGLRGDWRQVLGRLRARETWVWVFPSAVLISGNWWLYIWAVNSGYVLETSFGYFLNPLINVVLGMLFLGERLRVWQKVAVILVVIAIANLLFHFGKLPWIALALGLSFGMYGLLKKKMKSDALTSLTVETWLLLIPSATMLALSPAWETPKTPLTWILIIGAGVVTALPLYFFARAAKHLTLSTLGLFQYLAPSMQFLLAVFAFHEPFDATTFFSFAIIWTALGIYTWDSFRNLRASRLAASA